MEINKHLTNIERLSGVKLTPWYQKGGYPEIVVNE